MSILKMKLNGEDRLVKGYYSAGGISGYRKFTSESLAKVVSPNSEWGTDCKFIPNNVSNDFNLLTVDNVPFLREYDWEIMIEFFIPTGSRNNHCLTGSNTSNWWTGPGINLDKSSGDLNYYINVCPGTPDSTNWNKGFKATSNIVGLNSLNRITFNHFKNSDDFMIRLNGVKIIKWTSTVTPFYGTCTKFAIGGIYNNTLSFLFNQSSSHYITSSSYLKINGKFLDEL